MTLNGARQIAAQAWCDPETSGILMDVRLAEAFAKRLIAAQVEQRQRIIAIIKGGDRPWQELVDAILAQEE